MCTNIVFTLQFFEQSSVWDKFPASHFRLLGSAFIWFMAAMLFHMFWIREMSAGIEAETELFVAFKAL